MTLAATRSLLDKHREALHGALHQGFFTWFIFAITIIGSTLLDLISNPDSKLMNNIQKLFAEKIEIFSPVEFSKVSVLTGIVKITLKVRKSFLNK